MQLEHTTRLYLISNFSCHPRLERGSQAKKGLVHFALDPRVKRG